MKNTIDKINDYLQLGGLFNPELMEHHKVSDLLLECREQLMKAQEENVRLHEIAMFLFDILDDIDTASDEAKDNHNWYRLRVEHLHRKRFEVMETDGYTVKVKI